MHRKWKRDEKHQIERVLSYDAEEAVGSRKRGS
jgi:hypothetical protein